MLALSLLCLITAVLILASCADHEHNFGATWRQDDKTHWHACLVEECTEVADKSVHNFVKDGIGKDATCDEPGLKKVKCQICGMKSEEVVEPLGHKLSEKVISPSCAGDGYTEITCSRKNCKYSEKKDVVPGGHEYGELVIEPTCTEGGLTVVTCVVCGQSEERDLVNALGHDEVEFVVEPTCIAEGYTTVICTRCDYTDLRNPTEKVAHNYVNDTVPPTCTEGGYSAMICSVCKDAQDKTDLKEALGHNKVNGTPIAPTCLEDGYTPVSCTRCDFTEKIDIEDALGHDVVKGEPVPARCTIEGYTPVTCSRCDYKDQIDKVEPIGHKYYTEEDAEEGVHYRIFDEDLPTCDNEGQMYYICLNCRQMPKEEGKNPVAIPALGHDMQYVETVAPTCTLDGFDVNVCSRCEKEENPKNGDATGHTYYMEANAEEGKHFIVTLEPTCDEEGERSYYCQTEGCGALAIDDTKGKAAIAKLNHNWYVSVAPWCGNNSVIESKCSNVCRGVPCDAFDTKDGPEKIRHTYNFDVKIVPETCVDFAVYECAKCYCEFVAYEGDEYGQPTNVHRYENPIETIPPTCTKEGYTVYACVAGECGTTERKDYKVVVAHTLDEVSELGTVTCIVCNKSYVDITAEKILGSEALCICGQDSCVCDGTTADWEGFSKPKDPMPIVAGQEFVITEVVWTDGDHALEIGNGLIVLNSDEYASYVVTIYTADGANALFTFEREGTSVMVDLYQYAAVGKVVITSTSDANVSFYKTI